MILKNKQVQQVLVHTFLWVIFYGLMLYPFISQFRTIPPDFPIRLLLIIILFYFNYFYLVPNLLLKKGTSIYIITSLLIIVVITTLIYSSFPLRPPKDFPPFVKPRDMLPRRLLASMIIMAVPLVISTMLRLYVEWRKNEDLRKIGENEKIHSELQFLKTQLNPHFLFNSLNAIYSLSVKKSSDTSEAIISLSELMRYMLYEANKNFVPLHKELEYIKNYVQLQRLRLADSENVTLKISGEDKGKVIPPLLFISFIENAFKYGTDYKGKTNVRINLSIKEESIHLYVMNKIGVFKKKSKSSGVGLKNIRNRLALLYPSSHILLVNNDEESYTVDLTLNL